MEEYSSKNDEGEAVIQQITTAPRGEIVTEQRLPEGKRRMMKLGFDRDLLSIKCMDQGVPHCYVDFYAF